MNSQISVDLGICASLIGAMETGSFAAGTNNLEMINAQLYSWVYEWQKELNHVINKNIIQNDRAKVEVYYFPTSFVNRKSFFDSMKNLYDVGGSLSFLIASAGVDVDAYLAVLDSEIAEGYFNKYLPHLTSSTISKDDKVTGRPTTDTPTDNTIKSQYNKGNALPSQIDNK